MLDIGEGGVEVDEDGALLAIGARARDVLDPLEVQPVVGHLQIFAVVEPFEDGEEDGDALHDDGGADLAAGVVDFDAVADVVGVFEKDEDAAVEEFVDGSSDAEA